jgi:hypothetical protein
LASPVTRHVTRTRHSQRRTAFLSESSGAAGDCAGTRRVTVRSLRRRAVLRGTADSETPSPRSDPSPQAGSGSRQFASACGRRWQRGHRPCAAQGPASAIRVRAVPPYCAKSPLHPTAGPLTAASCESQAWQRAADRARTARPPRSRSPFIHARVGRQRAGGAGEPEKGKHGSGGGGGGPSMDMLPARAEPSSGSLRASGLASAPVWVGGPGQSVAGAC